MNTSKTAFITHAAEGINPKYPHSMLSKSARPRRIANRNEAAISDVTAGEVYSCFSAQRSDLSRISFGVDDLLT
jgi:hypothetical protein